LLLALILNVELLVLPGKIKKDGVGAHVAVGDNKTLGGIIESYMHLDMIMLNPTVKLDDILVVDNGKTIYK